MDLQYSANKIWIENEEGKTVGEVDFFQDEQGNYDIVHTEVDDSLRGQGAAGRLVQAAADYIRSTGHQTKAARMRPTGLCVIRTIATYTFPDLWIDSLCDGV